MVKPGKANLLQESLVFRVGSKPPVYYPPGSFGPEEGSNGSFPSDAESHGFTVLSDIDTEEEDELAEDYDLLPSDYPGDFDTHHEPGCENSMLYRSYDVFIYKAEDPRATIQFYVIHCFDYDSEGSIIIHPNKFGVICLLKVASIDFS